MPQHKTMSITSRREYLAAVKKKYIVASRQERSKLLNEAVDRTELHRKSVLRLLHGSLQRQPRQRQRGRSYGSDVETAIRLIAEAMNYACAERLTPHLVSMAEQLAAHGELALSEPLQQALSQISISTVRRLYQRMTKDSNRGLPRRVSRPQSEVAASVPMAVIPWDVGEVGHCEVDLVHHCGPQPRGDYVHTLQMIDVTSGWSERRAVLGRSGMVMHDAFACLFCRFPFPIVEIHSDNGSEFLNQHLLRFLSGGEHEPTFTRSRPGLKNDNRFVEESNLSRVRAFVGHARLDTVSQTWLLNEIYDRLGWYTNLFQPVMRLAEKTLLPSADGRSLRLRRRYDQAQTPFQRLCARGVLPEADQKRLAYLRQTLNPLQLRREIYALLDQLLATPTATPGDIQDVYLTLSRHRLLWRKGELAVR